MSSCCSCWGGSQTPVGDESPRSIAETFACAAPSGLLPEEKESLEQYRNKISADSSKYQAPKEVIISPPPTLNRAAGKAAVPLETTAAQVSVVTVIESLVIERLVDPPPLDLVPLSSPRSEVVTIESLDIESPVDPPPLDFEPLSSPRSDPEPRSRRTSSAYAHDHDHDDEGIEEISEPLSVPTERSDSTTSETSDTVPETTSAWSGSQSEAPSLSSVLAESTATVPLDNSTSKLAIPCTCEKGEEKARKQTDSAKMSRGGRPVQGVGSGPGPGNNSEEENEDVVGLRAPRPGYITFGDHQRRAFQRRSPGRSMSPVKNPEYIDDDGEYDLRAYVADDSALDDAFDNLYQQRAARPAASGRGAMAAAPRQVPLRAQQPMARARGRGRGRGRGREVDLGRPGAMALGDENWQLERRRREVANETRQNAANESSRQGRAQLQDGEAADGFQPQQGDLLVRHRKWPGEPMMEFYDVQCHVIREQDQLLRHKLQYDRRTDTLVCRAIVWRATRVDVADAQGNAAQEIRWDDAGSTQMTLNSFVQQRGPRNRYTFGRRFEPRHKV